MNIFDITKKLFEAFNNSPHPSLKVSNYFPIYAELFGHLIDTDCTFIETGVLNGGSLFMWRSWLGAKARIIGVDLNPSAKKWEQYGFEIYIGDQGDPNFWNELMPKIGKFDALLDDGGHQSFQQIVSLSSNLQYMKPKAVIAIEDTVTSHMRDFDHHRNRSFLEYAKDATDILAARNATLWPSAYPKLLNLEILKSFNKIYNIQFFTGIVAFKANEFLNIAPEHVRNFVQDKNEHDFRYDGHTNSAIVEWPDPFMKTIVHIPGQQ